MHDIFENPEKVKEIDAGNMLDLLMNFDSQIKEAAELGDAVKIEKQDFLGVKNVVFMGVGGSAIGAEIVRSFLLSKSALPMIVNRSYTLPNFVNHETLLFVSSYSGNTEEAVSALEEGIKRGASLIAITSDGKIAERAEKTGVCRIALPKGFPPRAALGFSVVPILKTMQKLGIVSEIDDEIENTVRELRTLKESYGIKVPEDNNKAKQLAKRLYEKFVFIYAPHDFFDAVALRWRGQLEENSKCLASHHVVPEMNHNEIVGWRDPERFLKKFAVVFLRDHGDHSRIALRMDITKEIIRKTGAEIMEVESSGKSILARMFSLIYLGDFVTYYLAILYGIDPTPVKVIDYLKGELAKV